ncbi:GW dipeptide domain-containing protein [Weissella confusa]|uniref:GW dipeptide domain-containing protein n=1 Tax=Weissella confusa TaxID=1583 RepID=UPI0015F63412|nr:GW dipeptide domain-containing protein [Weissella confusa]MBA5932665.1 SH3-like domain-containing protein [Weissella confusa]UYY91032.1 GW dipeptide domain-containing protein [Weissella confusa]
MLGQQDFEWGAYHYSTYSTTSEATAEANYFVDTAQSLGLSDTTYMVDDLEAESTKTSNTTQLAETFKRQVNNRGYGKTLLYTYASYTQQQGLKFNAWDDKNVWMASYPAKPSKDNLWYTNYGMWQWNSKTNFPGITGTYDVSIDYDNLSASGDYVTTQRDVNYFGTFNQSNRNDGLYPDYPWNTGGDQYVGSATQYNGQQVVITKEAVTNKGTTWAGFYLNGRLIWVDKAALSNVSTGISINKRAMFIQKNRNDGLFTNAPYGMINPSGIGSVSATGNDRKAVTVERQITVNGVLWYGGYIDGIMTWFDAQAVVQDDTAPVDKNYVATINENGRNDSIYEDKPWEYRSKSLGLANQLSGRTILVTGEWTTPDGVTWVRFSWNGKTVWVDKQAVSQSSISDVQSIQKRALFEQNGRNDSFYSNAPYGVLGASGAGMVGTSNQHKSITVEKKVVVNGVLWYGGYIDGKFLWFDSKAVIEDNSAPKLVKYSMEITQSKRNDSLYLEKPWEYRSDYYKAAKEFEGQVVQVRNEWKTPDGVTWINFTVDNRNVWMDKSGASTVDAADVHQRAMFIQNDRNDGLYLNAPYGSKGAQYVGSVKSTGNDRKSITVEKSVIKNNVTWYGGNLDGKFYWFDSAAVVEDNSNPVAVNKQMVISQFNRNDGIYEGKPWEYRSNYVQSATQLNNKTVTVTQEWTTPDGVTWSGFQLNGRLVWIDSQGITNSISKRALFIQNGRNDGLYKDAPYGLQGAHYIGSVDSTNNTRHSITVEREVVLNGVTWYGGYLNGELYWFDSLAVVEDNSSAVAANYDAVVRQDGRNDGLYRDKPWEYRTQWISSAQKLAGQKIHVVSEWQTPDGVTWVGFNWNNQLVWLDKAGIAQ